MSNNSIKTIYRDRTGVIWIGTGDGLNKFNPYKNLFVHYQQEEQENSLISNVLTGFCEDNKGNIWISTFQGVSKMNKQGVFQNYGKAKIKDKTLSFQNIRDISKDRNGNLWFSRRDGLYQLDFKDNQFHFYPLIYQKYMGSDLLSTFVDNRNHVWAGTYGNGVFEFDIARNQFTGSLNAENSLLSSDYIKDITQLTDGTLCFATLRTGIDLFFPSDSSFRNIRFSSFTHHYESDYINNVFEDSRRHLWVLSWYGAFVLDEEYQLIDSFTTDQGLISNELTAITEDINGDIWLGSVNGVSHILFGDDTSQILNYTTEDGLCSNSIATGAAFTAGDERIYLGGANGFNVFDVRDIRHSPHSDVPVITQLHLFNKQVGVGEKINGQIVLDRQVHLKKEIRLNHKQQIVSFHFSAPDFSQNRKIMYAYKLDGLDKEWVYAGQQVYSASYSNLYPGTYCFRVKAENDKGIWSEEKTLLVHVYPPFWATPWAYLFYVVLMFGVLYGILRIFLYQERLKQKLHIETLQHEKEYEISNLKIRFFTNLSHDIRTPLTLIVGPLDSILKKESLSASLQKQIEIIRNNAYYLLSLINQLLDFRKMDTGKNALTVSRYSLTAFVAQITHAFEPYANQRNIVLTFDSEINEDWVWFDPHLMAKVFYNLISNAIKFTGENGRIRVVVSGDEDTATVRIIDNGIGIDPEEQERIFDDFYQLHNQAGSILNTFTSGSGIGLSIAKKYVELHHGKIQVTSSPGKGSSFTVKLKKGNEHFEVFQLDKQEHGLPTFEIPYLYFSRQDESAIEEVDPVPERNMVLIVDDHPDIIQFVAHCIGDRFNIFSARQGSEALIIAEKELPDLIISDVMMPEMDGYEFCRKLKENILTNHIPLLFLTAKTSLEDTLKGLELGAYDYITKPFNESVLKAKVDSLIRDLNALKQKNGILSHTEEKSANQPANEDPFLLKVIQVVEGHLEDPELASDLIEQELKISKNQLYRKLKAVSGMSVTDLIRMVRIKKASDLLLLSDLNVSEIAYDVGFSDPFYFSKCFKKEMGLSPLQYRKEKRNV
ncbi:MAG: response regulator [Tannerella sp.]|nr:response regulator [Tannerella sp.]